MWSQPELTDTGRLRSLYRATHINSDELRGRLAGDKKFRPPDGFQPVRAAILPIANSDRCLVVIVAEEIAPPVSLS